MSDQKTKILLIDDDPFLINMYSIKFKPPEFGFSSLQNADGDFVNTVVGIAPDLILMDLDFPGHTRNGAEAADVLQLDERTKYIPIIFLTNAENPEQVKIAKGVPTAGFLTKVNLIPSEVVSKVQELYSEFLKKKEKSA